MPHGCKGNVLVRVGHRLRRHDGTIGIDPNRFVDHRGLAFGALHALPPISERFSSATSAINLPCIIQGFADRQTWESWLGGLSGQYRTGAEFWAGQRSLPHPAGCFAAGGRDLGTWSEGCVAGQQRLRQTDIRRTNEPDYRLGWNSFIPDQAAPHADRV